MTEDLQPGVGTPAPPPSEDSLRRVLRSVPPLPREGGIEGEIAKVAAADNHHRSHCRSDAMTITARARQRRGADLTTWTPDDVDTVYAIAELLMRLK